MKILGMLTEFALRNAIALAAVCLVVVVALAICRSRAGVARSFRWLLAALSGLSLGALGFLFVNHIRFPMFLDLMEGVVFQHFQRAAAFQPIYVPPTPEYVPLAYNALYYVLAVPFSWVFGANLSTLRLISILASIGIGATIYAVLTRQTGSRWWGLIGAGLFAASYSAMDAYIDTAHSDSCFVLCSLAGSALISTGRARGSRLLGLAVLIASFWFKQHGALFAIGGVLYLTWDEGVRRSWPYWLLAVVFGPVSYLFVAPAVFGPAYHFFTFQVPSAWSSFSGHAMLRFAGFFGITYAWLSLAAAGWFVSGVWKKSRDISIWHVQLVAAFGTGFLGSLDPGASYNVFIPLATWIILTGVWGLSRLSPLLIDGGARELVVSAALVGSFALVAYNPLHLLMPWHAETTYADFVQFLESLDGTVYEPTLGQLPSDYTFYPAAHWVALEDLVRGPGRDVRNNTVIPELLSPLLESEGPVYLLDNYPLDRWPWFHYLNDHFVLEEDLGHRFEALGFLPGRFDHGWPRYLYRRRPAPEVGE